MNKLKLLSDPESCLVKAKSDEPLFVLRANDPIAAETVMFWARRAGEGTDHSPEKRADARKIAAEMGAWRNRRATIKTLDTFWWLYFDDLSSNSHLWDVPLATLHKVQTRDKTSNEWHDRSTYNLTDTARDINRSFSVRCAIIR